MSAEPFLDQRAQNDRHAPDGVAAVIARMEDVAEGLAFVVDTLEPQQILVLSDLPSAAVAELDVTAAFATCDELQEHLARLGDSSLSFAGIAVTMPVVSPAWREFWQAVCAGSDRLALRDDLRDDAITRSHGEATRTAPVERVRRRAHRGRVASRRGTELAVTSPRRITIVMHRDAKPKRVYAKASLVAVVYASRLR